MLLNNRNNLLCNKKRNIFISRNIREYYSKAINFYNKFFLYKVNLESRLRLLEIKVNKVLIIM